ncbi:hypothetical protein NM208_g15010 [Fusarium decemcellulare]|uniref:Uncharacterized protein n=1 Tax=Fusarium decemcellulare TaxID=57161 RepID=A0ACC1RES3_9HYPO|nr:hypothetical protein NM208_g15010 [Fusarium decemcellulare]
MQVASEIVLTGRRLSAKEMHSWGIVNKVVPESKVVDEALRYAELIAENSPDAIVCARAGLRQAWETADVEEATDQWHQRYFSLLEKGENIREGLAAFVLTVNFNFATPLILQSQPVTYTKLPIKMTTATTLAVTTNATSHELAWYHTEPLIIGADETEALRRAAKALNIGLQPSYPLFEIWSVSAKMSFLNKFKQEFEGLNLGERLQQQQQQQQQQSSAASPQQSYGYDNKPPSSNYYPNQYQGQQSYQNNAQQPYPGAQQSSNFGQHQQSGGTSQVAAISHTVDNSPPTPDNNLTLGSNHTIRREGLATILHHRRYSNHNTNTDRRRHNLDSCNSQVPSPAHLQTLTFNHHPQL